MTTLLLTHPCFVNHDTGYGHPERPDRMRAIDKVLAHELFSDLKREEAPLRADVEEAIALAHPRAYIDWVKSLRPSEGEEPVRLDPDTVLSPKSWEPALRAVGAGLAAVDAVMDPAKSGVKNAFAQVRPCGHHAEVKRAMGFCIFNNAAVAALYARKTYGLERVAVVDFDVHHGNGTQAIFEQDPRVLYLSSHQSPLYPDTGYPDERGVGNVLNAPLRPASGGDALRAAWEGVLLPALEAFRPQLVLVSAGFDAHWRDPLAQLQWQAADYAWLTGRLVDIADRHAGGRIVSMLEGGYDLQALRECSVAHVDVLQRAGER